MAFKMKGWQAHGNSPLDNYKKGYYGEGKSSGLKKVGTEGPPKGRIGSEYRKAEYDARGWAYDDTIAGYNRDSTPISIESKDEDKVSSGKDLTIKKSDSEAPKKSRKKWKDTKVGKFLGAGQSEKRKARRAKLRESRGNMGSDKQLKAVRTKIKGLFGGKK